MASSKDILRRIKSVNNTKKITRAMEMVAAAKMRRAVEAVLRTRTYANLSWNTVMNLSATINGSSTVHPLLLGREKVSRVAIFLIASNRGLCGGFNSSIIVKAVESVRKHQDALGVEADFFIMGKKAEAINRNYGFTVVADFEKADSANDISEVIPVAKMLIEQYLSGYYDKVMVAYTDFVNAAKQLPRVKQLLPVDISARDKHLGLVGDDTRLGFDHDYLENKDARYTSEGAYTYEYKFEPSPREVLDEMLPRLIEIQLFQAVLESNASEHSARMQAMHQANDAAIEMVKELTLNYNKARQAGITAEIAEISAGANALSEA